MIKAESAVSLAILFAIVGFLCGATLANHPRCDHRVKWTCDNQTVEMEFEEGQWEARRP